MCDGKPAPRQKRERHSSRLRGERRSRGAARTPQSRLRGATKRNAPPRRPPPPALRAAARPSSAPEAAPARSSRYPDAGLDAAPPSKSTKGRKSRARGHSSGKAPHRGSVPRERSSKYDRNPRIANSSRKVSTRPGVGRAHPSAPSLRAGLWPRALVYFRGYNSEALYEQRGRSATRGGSCNSRGPAALPQGRPPAQPARCPRDLHPAGAAQGWGQSSRGSAGRRRAPGPPSRVHLTLLLPGSWLPGPAPSREGRAEHWLQQGRHSVHIDPRYTSAAHQQRQSLPAPRERGRMRRRAGSTGPQQGRPDRVSPTP